MEQKVNITDSSIGPQEPKKKFYFSDLPKDGLFFQATTSVFDDNVKHIFCKFGKRVYRLDTIHCMLYPHFDEDVKNRYMENICILDSMDINIRSKYKFNE